MAVASRPPGFADGARFAATLALVAALGIAALSSPPDVRRVLIVALVAPLTEESIFRAGLQEALSRQGLSSGQANGWTAIAFTAAHVLTHGGHVASIAVVLPALALGFVYGRTRRLRDAVALHAVMNTAWLAATAAGLRFFQP